MEDDQLRCPLPVVRLDETEHEAWSVEYEARKPESADGMASVWLESNPEPEREPAVAVCGEPLFAEGRTTADLMAEDVATSTDPLDLDHYGNAWRVTCAVGHVLLVPDDQGNDDLPRLPLTPAFLAVALGLISPA